MTEMNKNNSEMKQLLFSRLSQGMPIDARSSLAARLNVTQLPVERSNPLIEMMRARAPQVKASLPSITRIQKVRRRRLCPGLGLPVIIDGLEISDYLAS